MIVHLHPWERTPYWVEPERKRPSSTGTIQALAMDEKETERVRELEKRRVPFGFQREVN